MLLGSETRLLGHVGSRVRALRAETALGEMSQELEMAPETELKHVDRTRLWPSDLLSEPWAGAWYV